MVRIEQFIVNTEKSTESMANQIHDDDEKRYTKSEQNINELETQL